MAETAIIVPVLRRPQNAAPFMASLRASLGPTEPHARVYAIGQDDDPDTMAAWMAAGASVLPAPGTTFAVKVNHGYRSTGEPWMFLVGDDVRFQSRWLANAQLVASDRYHVVGINDLGDPRVLTGEHAAHLLVRRSYVDERGASWDGPKTVAHEGYRHWWVDDEIVTVAKRRGVWVVARSAVVEHLHPLYGKAEMDEIYELGQQSADVDRALFERRTAEHLVGVS
jgi:hypothetical protein